MQKIMKRWEVSAPGGENLPLCERPVPNPEPVIDAQYRFEDLALVLDHRAGQLGEGLSFNLSS